MLVLTEHYVVEKDWKGEKYCGITLDWDFVRRKVHLSMPGYCSKALTRFCHKTSKLLDQPHQHAVLVYGAKIQYAKEADKAALLDPVDKTFIQQVKGTFLYYVRVVDATMLLALSVIASDQAAPTENTMKKTLKFLDYVTTHPDTILAYSSSNMILSVHS